MDSSTCPGGQASDTVSKCLDEPMIIEDSVVDIQDGHKVNENKEMASKGGAIMSRKPRKAEGISTKRMKRGPQQDLEDMTKAIKDISTTPEVVSALQVMVEAIKSLSAEIAELRLAVGACECKKNGNICFEPASQTAKATNAHAAAVYAAVSKPASRKQSTASIIEVPQPKKAASYAEVAAGMGNGPPALVDPRKAGVGKKIMGSSKDRITFTKPQHTAMETTDSNTNPDLVKAMTLPPPRQPQDVSATVYYLEKCKPRESCPTGMWRKILKERNIQVYSILRPYATTVELLVNPEHIERMKKLLVEIQKTPGDSRAYIRRDGKAGPLGQDVIKRMIERRINMLEWETSGVGIRYLEGIILEGIQMVEDALEKYRLSKMLKDMMEHKKWSLTPGL